MSNTPFSLKSRSDAKDTVKVMIEMDGNLGRSFKQLAKDAGLAYAEVGRQMIRHCVTEATKADTASQSK